LSAPRRTGMLRAINTGSSTEIPVVIPYLEIFLRDHWEEVTTEPWWIQDSWDLPARIRVDEALEAIIDVDWMSCGLCPPRIWREAHRIKVIGDEAYLVGIHPPFEGSVEKAQRPPPGGLQDYLSTRTREGTSLPRPLVELESDIDEFVAVIGAGELVQSGMLDHAEDIVRKFRSRRFIVASVDSPLWEAYKYFGFKGLVLNLYRKPKLIEYLLEKLTSQQKERIEAFARVGVDGVWVEECLCSADVLSLKSFERFALPYTRELISEVNKQRMKSIYYHCGDVSDRLELMVKTGPDCISLEESKKNFVIDLEWVDKVVNGRACIFGNVNAVSVLQNGSLEELTNELNRQIKIGRNHGRFVMSLGSPVTPRTPASRVRLYVDLARSIGKRL